MKFNKAERKFQNLDLAWYEASDSVYGIPRLDPIMFIPHPNGTKFIGFNQALTCKNPESSVVHFFVDDYQFDRIWNMPERYARMLQRFQYVVSPDWSIYRDMPDALRIYNVYRSYWMARYWADNYGIKVIPNVMWSDERSWNWSFDGLPEHGAVCVSSVGCLREEEAKRLFIDGFNFMVALKKPKQILFNGTIPNGLNTDSVQIVPMGAFFEGVVERRKAHGKDGQISVE